MPRNAKTSEKMRENRSEAIRKAALKLFAQGGLSGSRLRDIAEEAGMALGLIYHYYSSKEAVYQDLVLDALNKMNQGADALLASEGSATEKLKYTVSKILKDILESDDFVQTCKLIAGSDFSTGMSEDIRDLIAKKRERPYEVVAILMEKGQQEGTVLQGDPYLLSVLFWTSLNGLAIYRASRKGPIALPSAEDIERLFIRQNCEADQRRD